MKIICKCSWFRNIKHVFLTDCIFVLTVIIFRGLFMKNGENILLGIRDWALFHSKNGQKNAQYKTKLTWPYIRITYFLDSISKCYYTMDKMMLILNSFGHSKYGYNINNCLQKISEIDGAVWSKNETNVWPKVYEEKDPWPKMWYKLDNTALVWWSWHKNYCDEDWSKH